MSPRSRPRTGLPGPVRPAGTTVPSSRPSSGCGSITATAPDASSRRRGTRCRSRPWGRIGAVTVNGGVAAETPAGPVEAVWVNGSVRARLRGFADSGAVKLVTVNGSVTAELPAHLDAVVEATAVTGSIHSDYALPATGPLLGHKLPGTLRARGRGGAAPPRNRALHPQKLAS